jgi:peptidoglycan L-alanyl-D-glutamate endopeptidase CwlK
VEHNSIVYEKLNKLHPQLIQPALRAYNNCVKDKIPIRIIWTKRTVDEQNVLYKFGRTLPGKIITIHKGGYSPHNYGLALDFCFEWNNKLIDWSIACKYKLLRTRWENAVYYFEQEGWDSGWRFDSYEPGHVQNLLGKELSQYVNEQNKQWNL